jgi:ribA/ribD-fused uncharacterized protein
MTNKKRAKLTIIDNYAFFLRQFPSNWESSPFYLDGVKYLCVEQFMMAKKAELFNDTDCLNKIMKATNPAEHKKLGREIKNYDDEKWSKVRYNIVFEGTMCKYTQNEELKRLLMDTGNLQLVEASPYDSIWGIGMDVNDENLMDTDKWGQNLLGKIITNVRECIKASTVEIWQAV